MGLTFREKELVNRGYDENIVRELASFDMEYALDISKSISNELSKGCNLTGEKIAIYIGGVPGSGKTTALREIKNSWNNNNVICIVGLDNFRIRHPNYKRIEDEINRFWVGKEETDNNSRGNDIADFTSNFASLVSDLVIFLLTDQGYNVAIEWGMRNPIVPLKTMERLKQKGYKNVVKFIVVDKYTSKDGCKVRDDILNQHEVILRRIPAYFHDDAVKNIPYSAKKIYDEGYIDKKIIDEFFIVDRDDNVLWSSESDKDLVDTYFYYINNVTKEYKNDPSFGELSYKEELSGN